MGPWSVAAVLSAVSDAAALPSSSLRCGGVSDQEAKETNKSGSIVTRLVLSGISLLPAIEPTHLHKLKRKHVMS